ncbi:hypothetical protein B0H34DRAFT_682476 [Crassisporium funariophilum]|nr:hypothetical protein B0H34DRAFT_682476 [Crassisporium funariophilum]
MATKARAHSNKGPLIPEKYLDVPSQRLYFVSLGLLCQSIKILDFFWSLAAGDDNFATGRKWLLVDFAYCILLAQLRIPRLNYSKASVLLQISLLWFLDGVMFGGISVNAPVLFGTSLGFTSSFSDIPSTPEAFSIREILAPMSFGLISSSSSSRDAHLLGQHTVRMSPISTAHLNPQGLKFCLSPSNGFVLIPIVLNNTHIAGLKYSVTPLGYAEDLSRGKIDMYESTTKDLKTVEQNYREQLQVAVTGQTGRNADDYDEYDDDDDEDLDSRSAHSTLQKTQSLAHIMMSRPGVVRLVRAYDAANVDARLVVSEAVVVPCPHVEFVDDRGSAQQSIRCAGQDADLELNIKVHGVPPLSLRWLKTINGNREQFLVEGIEGEHKDDHAHKDDGSPTNHADHTGSSLALTGRVPDAQDVRIPLTISLEKPGTYLYALEEITDGVGNVIRVGSDVIPPETDSLTQTKTTRSFMVLRKPAVSFAHCSSDSPTSLLIGSEASLSIKAIEADKFDAPWEVYMKYQPPTGGEKQKDGKRFKPWNKTLKTEGDRQDLTVRASTPGDYKIVGIKGKYCTGTVLAPDSCRVVEKPLPSAEIEWKRIHECSGDTGVSASLILRGTPPFQVYYRMQRDSEPAREIAKTFTSSRAELTLQPERSGHYVFTFASISDANYRKVELKGPSIDQMIHPLASADFSESHGSGRSKRIISTCSGDTVDIGVDLRGTGPWNLELQIIGPQTVEVLQVTAIETSKKTIKVSIPKEVEQNGGTFEIALMSVEDASKCKRPISVPGIMVNVKRVVPTVQFYGKEQDRHVVVAENERASLPLRLTGEGPWRVKYRREGSDRVMTTTLHNPNDNLQVTGKGVYEIIGITDAQCPGAVLENASTYRVDWIPRPSAKLSSTTDATYEARNGSHILRPICEGVNDHVDLDLTGRPPFQIMYNIAQNSDSGGTEITGQPTFNSIQPRTRFQLHTSTPGRMYYEVKQIGDTAYPLAKSKDTIIPKSERLLFEQQVSVRPSARFRNHNRMVYCLNDALVPLDLASTDGYVVFEGTPPFTLVLAIKNLAASHVDRETIQVSTNTWRLDLPSYTFTSIGPHLISIETVTDSSSCEQAALDPLFRSIWVDVAETAAIIPFERREDICVGEVTQFQLEGIPPWTIAYQINSKSYNQEAKVSPFSLLQQQPGLFVVSSIAHQQKMCKAAVTDLRFKVHALPSAQVGHGKKILQDIHEGDQAEIIFTLIGEPPFTFTYQRSELTGKKGGIERVLETHTVSRVLTKEYSVFSALEGTWTVTSISDRYCRYPPAQPDMASEKQRN